MNAPFSGNLHLKILQKALKYSDNIINLAPTRWLQDPLAEYKKNNDFKTFNNIVKKIYKLEIINGQSALQLFNAKTGALGIYYFDGKEHNFKFDRSFGKRIIERTKKFYSDYMNHKKTNFWCPVAHFHWDSDIGPFDLTLSENGTYAKTNWTKGLHDTYEIFYFDTKDELENFRAFLQLKSYKWILGHLLIGKRLPIKLIPMMPDYTHKWDDNQLYEYFSLTSEEIKIIEEEMK